jgi:serine/threonine-protein kinase
MNKEKMSVGRYLILKTIGKGGMGEVLLAYDPIYKREVALKRIKEELKENETIKKRFLKEAKIASQLTHPSIIPIYSIHIEKDDIYYTMPYVEGEILKDILEEARNNKNFEDTKGFVPNLSRIFLNVCEAIAYTHSKNILHKDLKPSNIIIGKYGEVLILDWGIANFIDKPEKKLQDEDTEDEPNITRAGKIAGTVAFMAPERAFGEPSSILTDIYALGVILYQILTLTPPFRRHNITYFRKYSKEERLIDPIERAPRRDIPRQLSVIAKKCLSFKKEDRYQKVEDIIKDLKNYIEGRPEWLFYADLNIKEKKDWIFNENIFLPKHTAITQSSEHAKWVSVMLAKPMILEHLKIEAEIFLKEQSSGICFLISVGKSKNKLNLEAGYCLYIENQKIKLIRSNTLVMETEIPDLTSEKWHHIKIEKYHRNFLFFLEDKLILSYPTHFPTSEKHLGILYKDLNFSIKNFKIFSSSNNIMINCLEIPDAFLAKKDFDTAYDEYKKITSSFPGRMEGLRAIFRAGITLLAKAKQNNDKTLFQKALDEFENLRKTPSAPMEYFGKSLVYADLKEFEEEVKCLELATRKFKKHPLLPIIKEHIIYRIHSSTLKQRSLAYRLILLVILHIPSLREHPDTKLLIDNLQKHLEKLFFILPSKESLAIDLAFRLGKKETLFEIIKNTKDPLSKENAYFSLLELGLFSDLKKLIKENSFINIALNCHIKKPFAIQDSIDTFFQKVPKTLEKKHIITLIHILKYALDKKEIFSIKTAFLKLKDFKIPEEFEDILASIYLSYLLLDNKLDLIKKIFKKFPKEKLKNDKSPLFPIYGLFLYTQNRKKALKHLSYALETPYPKTPSLLSHYLNEKIKKWFDFAFFFEKRELYRQLSLFYKMKKDLKKESYFSKLSLQKF